MTIIYINQNLIKHPFDNYVIFTFTLKISDSSSKNSVEMKLLQHSVVQSDVFRGYFDDWNVNITPSNNVNIIIESSKQYKN